MGGRSSASALGAIGLAITAVLASCPTTVPMASSLTRHCRWSRACGAPSPSASPASTTRFATRSFCPRQVWYEEDWHAHDQRFWEHVLSSLTRGMLLIFDLGFLNYARFDQLTEQGSSF